MDGLILKHKNQNMGRRYKKTFQKINLPYGDILLKCLISLNYVICNC